MAVIYNSPVPIVWDKLVFHLDPANKNCIAENKRTDPFTDNGIKDLTGNISSIEVDDSADASYDTWKPQWDDSGSRLGEQLGYMKFHSGGAGSSGTLYQYGFLDLGAPVTGVTQFGETDSYTIDFWWNQDTTSADYAHQGGHLFGPRDVYTSYVSYSKRKIVYDSYSITINSSAGSNYYFRWFAGQRDYDNDDHNYYYANSATMTSFTDWYHQCCVFDLGDKLGGGSKIYTYTNGSLNTTGTQNTTGSANWYSNTYYSGNKYLGASNRNQTTGLNAESSKSNGADGKLGPFKIYNKALTSEEVLQNYNALKRRYI